MVPISLLTTHCYSRYVNTGERNRYHAPLISSYLTVNKSASASELCVSGTVHAYIHAMNWGCVCVLVCLLPHPHLYGKAAILYSSTTKGWVKFSHSGSTDFGSLPNGIFTPRGSRTDSTIWSLTGFQDKCIWFSWKWLQLMLDRFQLKSALFAQKCILIIWEITWKYLQDLMEPAINKESFKSTETIYHLTYLAMESLKIFVLYL